MTCIATDGKTIAADGRDCYEDLILTDEGQKLASGKDGSILATAGPAAANALVREWFENGEDYETIPKLRLNENETFHGLILRPSGRVEFLESNFSLVAVAVPAAIGSGGDVALGAMLAGKSPREAVEIAATRVSSVGGTIVEMERAKLVPGRK